MENQLNNTVSVVGNYNNIPTSVTSLVSVVTMINGLSITKNADKPIWADGNLTYTIVVTNETEKAYTNPVVTDKLDNNLIKFVDGSVTIDGQNASSSEYNYDESSNTLTITLTDIDASNSKTITFQVSKK